VFINTARAQLNTDARRRPDERVAAAGLDHFEEVLPADHPLTG
jgi:phosphoglycerate dehydrogenase-like enzyme